MKTITSLILLTTISLASGAFGIEFYNPTNALYVLAADTDHLNLATSRRIDQPALRYSLEQTGNLSSNWTVLAEYGGDGSAITPEDPAFSVSNTVINGEFEGLDFYRYPGVDDQGFYRLSYWWLDAVASGLSGEWSAVAWSNGVPQSTMNALLTNGSSIVISGTDAVANHLWIGDAESGSTLVIDSGSLTTEGQVVLGGPGGIAGSLVVNGGSFTVNNSGSDGQGLEIWGNSTNPPSITEAILIDFGNDSSFRGASVTNPDGNGNYWNSVHNGAFYSDMLDSSGNVTDVDLGFDSAVGTDFYNGPSGDTEDPSATVYNSVALGNLGVDEAVYDYYVSSTFQLQGLDPEKTYDLTFFGSHKYNTDNDTVYSVHSDAGYSNAVDSVALTVGVSADHNQSTTVTLYNVAPDAENKIYVKFIGSAGNQGYLNCMTIESTSTGSDADGAAATFAGGTSSLGDIHFNLNDQYAADMEILGSEAVVTGNSLSATPATGSWINGELRFTYDEAGIAPITLAGLLDLGSGSNLLDLAVDAIRYAGEPGSFPLIAAAAINGDWASVSAVGFQTNQTLYLAHTNGDVTLIVDAPMDHYADNIDETYVRIKSLDDDKYLYQAPGSTNVDYGTNVDLRDFGSHWFVRESSQAGEYWIRNRLSGEGMLVDLQVSNAVTRTLLLDFGTSSTYRGADVTNPDGNGNYWNGIGYGLNSDLVDAGNTATTIDFEMTTADYGTDYFNGPSGGTQDPAATVYNAAALGDLGVDEAVYDYFCGNSTGGYTETFELSGLDGSRQYNLIFFGSHKYSTDTVTRYSVTDSGGTVIDSVDLTVGSGDAHNQDTTVTLYNVSPDGSGKIYVKFVGNGGNAGYLNCMKIEEVEVSIGGGLPSGDLLMSAFNTVEPALRWKFHALPGSFRIENAIQTNAYITVGSAASNTATYTALSPGDTGQLFAIEPVSRGATVPWVSYDEDNYAEIGGGAQVPAPTYDRLQTHAEAQKRSVVLLDAEGAYVKWTVAEQANAFVLRYAIEDAVGGGGQTGTVTLDIRNAGGGLVQSSTIPVSSVQAWVYFDDGTSGSGDLEESNDPSFGRPAKRFSEARVKPTTTLQPGYTLELRRSSGEPRIWIDVVEAELIDDPITVNVPSEYLNVTSYGAVPDDAGDDWSAIESCISAAISAGKGVYIPEGVFRVSNKIDPLYNGVVIQGAGMWHTELLFTGTGVNNVGFWGEGRCEIHDLYMSTEATLRGDGGSAFRQYFGTGSIIENVWTEHFDTWWIGDYALPYAEADGLRIANCRIRNHFADGINLTRGTRNSIIDNCHFRATGDDSAASWANSSADVDQCLNNKFRYNTIECNYRAAGIGIFGGEGHDIHHNVIRDVVSGAGMRFNTVFASGGYVFSAGDTMSVYKNSIYRSGTFGGFGPSYAAYGAINLTTAYGDVRNITFEDILIDDVLNNGVYVGDQGASGVFSGITFDRVHMVNIGSGSKGTTVTPNAEGSMEYFDVHLELDAGAIAVDDQSGSFSIIDSGGPEPTNTVNRL